MATTQQLELPISTWVAAVAAPGGSPLQVVAWSRTSDASPMIGAAPRT